MDRSKLIKIALLVCSACCLIAAISLFAEGDIASGVCGLALAVVLGVFGFRKKTGIKNGISYSGPQKDFTSQAEKHETPHSLPHSTAAQTSFAGTYKVYIEEGGKRYHRDEKCSGMKNPKYVTLEYALMQGYTECKKCSRIK